jgi:hypothetical protein
MRRIPIAAAGAVSLLVDIKPGGPAEAAGLNGDFSYGFDNRGVSSMAGLFEFVHATPPGKSVVYVLRGDEVRHGDRHVERRLEALPGAREPESPVPDSAPLFADAEACTPESRAFAGWC